MDETRRPRVNRRYDCAQGDGDLQAPLDLGKHARDSFGLNRPRAHNSLADTAKGSTASRERLHSG